MTIFDIGEHDGQAFIVMEHFAGGTVADRLKAGDPIPVPLALRWLRETASALDAAHAADIVHRDVKPGNLLLDENGRLAVGDFGIASIAGETAVTAAGPDPRDRGLPLARAGARPGRRRRRRIATRWRWSPSSCCAGGARSRATRRWRRRAPGSSRSPRCRRARARRPATR